MTRPRIILADDHEIVLDGLKRILAPRFEIVATTSQGAEIERLAESVAHDAVVLDISMADLSGIEATRRLIDRRPAERVVVLTMHAEVAYAVEALRAGAIGYVLKNSAASELVTALDAAIAGRSFVSPAISAQVAAELERVPRDPPRASFALSERQRDVVRLIAKGLSAKQVGNALNISPRTVEFHKYRIMTELGLKTTADLVQFALKNNFISP